MKAGWQGLFAIEKSPMAFETLSYNLIGHKDKCSFAWPDWLPVQALEIQHVLNNFRDQLISLGGIELLTGGPPCQGYSLAGERRVDDERNYLFEHYLSFVELIKPKLILLENVSTFATPFTKTERGSNGHQVEETFNADMELQAKLRILEYEPFVACPVKAKDFGVPQLRPRYILIAIQYLRQLA